MIFEKITQLEQELKGKFEFSAEYNEEIIDYFYESIKENRGIDVTKLFNDVYSIHDGFNITIKTGQVILSEVNIVKLFCTFSNTFQERFIQVYDEWGGEFKIFTRQFYPLDIYRESLDSVTLTVIKIIDEEHFELWIWNNAGQKYKLKFKSIEEYLAAGVQCKFVIFWQYFYIDTDAMDFSDPFTKEWVAFSYSEATSRMEQALTTMKECSPNNNWAGQEKELERIKKINR